MVIKEKALRSIVREAIENTLMDVMEAQASPLDFDDDEEVGIDDEDNAPSGNMFANDDKDVDNEGFEDDDVDMEDGPSDAQLNSGDDDEFFSPEEKPQNQTKMAKKLERMREIVKPMYNRRIEDGTFKGTFDQFVEKILGRDMMSDRDNNYYSHYEENDGYAGVDSSTAYDD